MAHIPDGFLSAPVILGTAAASAAALAVAARRTRRQLEEREAPVLGATTAFVFAAQMFNFPLGVGTSAHLVGGVLVGALVGPWAAILVLFAVLLVQAMLFQDGGIAALGANTLNIAVVGAGIGYLLFRWTLALFGNGARRRMLAAALAAFCSTVLIGVAVSVELALSGTVPIVPALLVVGGGHLLVGVGEAVLTAAILALVVRSRPELLTAQTVPSVRLRRWAYATLLLSMGVAAGAGYLASARPDVLEAALLRLGVAGRAVHLPPALFAAYVEPAGGAWVAALVGVVLVSALVWGIALLLRTGRQA